MAEIVNLRMARKRAERTRQEQQAAENRTLHGRTAAEKQRDKAEVESAARHLTGHRREPETSQ